MSFILLGILNSQAAGAVGAGDYDLLETTTLTSSASSVTFSSLGSYSADYKHFQIRAIVRGSSDTYSGLQFNGDTGSKYTLHQILGNGSSVISDNGTSLTKAGASWLESGTNSFSGVVIDILDPFDSAKNTTTRELSGTGGGQVRLSSGLFIDTSSITSITLLPNTGSYQQFSRFSLYGIRG